MGAKKQTKGRAAGDKKGKPPGGTCYPCPGGEDHLKRRSSSPPVPPSPWLPALPPRKQTETCGRAGAELGSARGCKGRSPLHKNNLKSPPFPGGEGGGGIGAKKNTKGRVERQPQPPPPAGYSDGTVSRRPAGQAPAWRPNGRPSRQRRGTSPHHSNNFLRKM